MSKNIGTSEENLVEKGDEEQARKLSFFDNTIDESENDPTVQSTTMMKDDGDMMKKSNGDEGSNSDKKVLPNKENNKSFMEIESNREKKRWLYMSELGAIFGDEKHTREGFMKLFGSRVS
jgi:hypothetical protein